jgi:uncharacterized membrane protein YphA (DoxX/SURF4 family)
VARSSSKVLDGIGTLARLGLAAVWLISGAIKVVDIDSTTASVRAYQLFPDGAASLIGAVLPFLELALGLLVLLGIGTRLVGVLSIVLLLVYIAGIAQSWARGLTIDCGCFGTGGQVAAGQTQYPQDIARDTGFILLALWLSIRPRTFLAVDGLLHRGADDEADDEDVLDGAADEVGNDDDKRESSTSSADSGSASSAVGRE